MGVTTTQTNKPLNPRGNDQSPLAYNRAKLFSGKALDFDGVNDYVTFDGFAGTLSTNDAWTACGYFKTDSNTRSTWFSAHHSSGSNRIRVGTETNKDGLFYADSYTTDVQISDFDFKDGHWHFVALSRAQGANGSLVTLLVDGVELTSRTSGPNWDDATQFSLGQEYDGGSTSDFWDGLLANFKIFNTALTAAQVADLYNNPEKVVPTGVDNTALKLWLPMQEGAGTTAYDGSGNGNHGTISGATYVHGIGAPVSQTAVIDWNKGTNNLTESNNFSDSDWGKTSATITSGQSDPFGGSDAWRVDFASSANASLTQFGLGAGEKTNSIWLKADSAIELGFHNGADLNGITLTTSWVRYSVTQTNSVSGLGFQLDNYYGPSTPQLGVSFYAYNAQNENGSTAGPYVPTLATAQTSPVLLPQGLTTGRDITGVNLFENVRKQGALNLDGNSWAEVHDNASVDIGDFSIEMWVNINEFTGTYQTFLAKGDTGGDRSYELYLNSNETNFGSNVHGAVVSFATTNPTTNIWYHLVSTFDDSTNTWTAYVNGSQNTTASVSETQNDTDAPIIIGAWQTKTQFNTNGQIAQPRIYNRALTAAEVLQNYNSGKNTYK